MNDQLDHLDKLAVQVAKGDLDCVGGLSRGEYLYVALAANSSALLAQSNDTIAEAIARLGDEWTYQLVERWRYRGDPAKQ
ncbi:hypothetical protein [Pseudomonas sp.]|uniref:hypothetical protein n=1 Tax=Pseudomonas sp. TaxID=306 RepID=UPI00290702E7|nr:hypothetical protein [Pseudomonas sp.]MDU4254408.1 hypothetical protein [Pseudomonas sp.]